jgi:Mg-chelatase subunit ChlD
MRIGGNQFVPGRIVFLALALLVFFLAVTPSPAMADGHVNVEILDVDDSNFPEVRVVVAVRDRLGRSIAGLGIGSFQVDETGARASVARVETTVQEYAGAAVVLVMDASASMRGAPIAEAKAAASTFVHNLHPADQAAVVSFASGVTVRSGLTSNRNDTLAALSRLEGFGDSALYGAVIRSVGLLQEAPFPARAVVLLIDGREFGTWSNASREDALWVAAVSGVPIYVIGLGRDIDRPFLQEVARSSGGSLIEVANPNGLHAAYDQVSRTLSGQSSLHYVLTLRSSAPEGIENRSLRVAVSSSAGIAQAGLEYQTRREIIPATPVPPAPPAITEPVEEEAKTGGGGKTALIVVFAGLGVFAVAGVGAMVLYRRDKERRAAEDLADLSQRAIAVARKSDAAEPEDVDLALVIEGPEGVMRLPAGEKPVTIGSGSSCQVRLQDPAGRILKEHARVWSNGGKVIFHQLSASEPSVIRGEPVTWTSLQSGDEVQIGPYRLRVEAA